MDVLKNISKVWSYNLRRYRGERTQSAIAELAGMSLRNYQRLEKGSLPKSPKTTAALAKALMLESETSLFLDPDFERAISATTGQSTPRKDSLVSLIEEALKLDDNGVSTVLDFIRSRESALLKRNAASKLKEQG